MTGEAYNKITKRGDKGIIFRDRDSTTASSGNLVIAPHSDVIGGIRITADSKVSINKQVPTVELDVSGSIMASGSIDITNGASIRGGMIVSTGNVNVQNGNVFAQRIGITTNGTNLAPSLYWSNEASETDADTGFYHPTDGQISVITNKAEIMNITQNGVTVTGALNISEIVKSTHLELTQKGTNSLPAIYWSNGSTTGEIGTDTGISHPGDGEISVISNGTERMRVTQNGVSVNGNLIVNGILSANIAYSVQTF
jgi:hypothetical protein